MQSTSQSSLRSQLRTPATIATSDADITLSSPLDLTSVPSLNKPNCNADDSPTNVKISRSPPLDTRSSSLNKPKFPSPLDKLDYLHAIPPSPPVVDPTQLLVLSPETNPDVNAQHSIASPFVNHNPSPSPVIPSPLLHSLRLFPNEQRGSFLARDFDRLDIEHDDNDDHTDVLSDQTPHRVPSPLPISPA